MKKVLLLICVTIGCAIVAYLLAPTRQSQRVVLEQSDRFTLYSLQPLTELYAKSSDTADAQAYLKGKEIFHKNLVLGKIEITDPQLKADLVAALYRGIEEHDGGAAACFNPRHGVRVVKGRRTVDVVICFECAQVEFHENGRRGYSLISDSPEQFFNRVLGDAKVPRSKRRYSAINNHKTC